MRIRVCFLAQGQTLCVCEQSWEFSHTDNEPLGICAGFKAQDMNLSRYGQVMSPVLRIIGFQWNTEYKRTSQTRPYGSVGCCYDLASLNAQGTTHTHNLRTSLFYHIKVFIELKFRGSKAWGRQEAGICAQKSGPTLALPLPSPLPDSTRVSVATSLSYPI